MITDEGWLEFIGNFFGVDIEWISHVMANWNHLKQESGCGCYFVENDPRLAHDSVDPDANYCTGWLRIKVFREQATA